MTPDELAAEAWEWLSSVLPPRRDDHGWGVGSDDLSIFPEWAPEEEAAWVAEGRRFVAARYEAGFGAIAYPESEGGRGLTRAHDLAYQLVEGRFETPPREIWNIGFGMVLPTILQEGTDDQRRRFLSRGLRGELLFCQMFSEPDAGSDLAALSTRATPDGDEWLLTGTKVWTSMARIADFGLVLCRTDLDAPKHRGITAFLLRLDQPGVTIRPIRQITGGASFNEIVLDGARVPDADRLGDVNGGWNVAVTTLGNERGTLPFTGAPGSFSRLAGVAAHMGRADEAVARQGLVDVHIRRRILDFTARRANEAMTAGRRPGPEASLGKLQATDLLDRMGAVAAELLGPRFAADTGSWGERAWNTHVLGTRGLKVGGGTDEVQRTILGERVLGLPPEPRTDKQVAYRALRRVADERIGDSHEGTA